MSDPTDETEQVAPLPDAAGSSVAQQSSTAQATAQSAPAASTTTTVPRDDSRKQVPNVSAAEHSARMASPPDTAAGTTADSGTSGLSKKERIAANRRIIAEDPEWNLAPIERLSDLCVRMIVANFEKKPILKGIPDKYRDRIIAAVSIDIPLHIAAPLIPDESYWQRRSKTRFKLANVQEHGGSWKRLFFELYLRDRIETFVPRRDPSTTVLAAAVAAAAASGSPEMPLSDNDPMKQLLSEIKLGEPFVNRIHLRQLKPSEVLHDASAGAGASTAAAGAGAAASMASGQNAAAAAGAGDSDPFKETQKELLSKANDTHPDHVDLSLVLDQLVNLKDFNVYYGVKDCGINFSWTYFGMTLNDSLRLSAALRRSQLQRLVVQASAIEDDRCRLICSALLSNTSLVSLDLSHNKIGDSGARGLAKVLAAPTTALRHLRLSNNKIGQAGAQNIGKALGVNKSLVSLDLRLNHLGDGGGHAMCAALARNKHLQEIDLSGNGLGAKFVTALCALLRRNGPSLVSLDVSCNKLGNHGHTVALEGAAGAAILANASATAAAAAAAAAGSPMPPKEVGLFGATHGNIDGDLAGKMIFEAISQNKYVTKLDLRMTDLSPEFLVAIQGIINENGLI
nr:T-complex-associated testis-expressed protein 1 [Polyrhizophydium stewartii]